MSNHTLGELQHAIMRILWSTGEATAGAVHETLYPERGLAPTTIATMLRKMEDKGVVEHRVEGRQFVYRPTVSEMEVRSSMVGELLDRLFAGDPAALVADYRKAKESLGWQPRHSALENILKSAWLWQKKHPEGYKAA